MATKKTGIRSSAKKTTAKKTAKKQPPKTSMSQPNQRAAKPLPTVELDLENIEAIQSYYDQEGILLEKEVLFCLEWLSNGMKAGPAYSKVFGIDNTNTCYTEGSKLLGKPKVKAYVRREMNNRASRLGISSDYVANKYKVWAEGYIGDFVEVKTVSRGKVKKQVLFLKGDLESLTPEQRSCIKSIEPTKDGQIKLTMIDQKAALDSLAKLLGYTQDKLQINTEVGITLKFDSQDEEA